MPPVVQTNRLRLHDQWLLMAQLCRAKTGRAGPLCPSISDVNLLRYRKGIIDLDAEVSDGAFDFGVAEQQLHVSQVACAPVDQGGLGSAE
jgi:hypothetical protein